MASGDKVVIASKEHVTNSILDNIVDDVNTDDSTKSVSAKQAKILNDRTIKNDEDGVVNGSLDITNDLTKSGSTVYSSRDLNMLVSNISQPIVDAPLINNLDLKAGNGPIEFTRDGSATFIDRYGVLRTVDAHVPRFEKDGLLVEGPSTNIKLYSQITDDAFSNARCSITDNDSTAPNNATEAAKVTVTEDGSVYIYRRGTSEDEVTYTSSWFVKNGTTNGLFTLRFHANTFGDGCAVDFDLNTGEITDNRGADNATIEALANGWFRLSITSTSDTDSDGDDYMDLLYLTNDGVTDDYFYVWGNQLEKLPFATSYIPTTDDEVTRVGEKCVLSKNDNLPYRDFTLVYTANSYGTDTTDRAKALVFIDSTGNDKFVAGFSYSHNNKLFVDDDTMSSIYFGEEFDNTTLKRVGTVFSEGIIKVYVNGVLQSTTNKGLTNTYDYGSYISIGGADVDVSAGCLFGHISNLKIYQNVLTDIELNLI